MFRLAVFSLKDIVKYLLCLVTAITVIYMVNRYFFSHRRDSKKIEVFNFIEKQAVALIDVEMPQIKDIKKIEDKSSEANNMLLEDEEEISENNFLVGLINTQIGVTERNLNKRNTNNNSQNINIGDEINEKNVAINQNSVEDKDDSNSQEPKILMILNQMLIQKL